MEELRQETEGAKCIFDGSRLRGDTEKESLDALLKRKSTIFFKTHTKIKDAESKMCLWKVLQFVFHLYDLQVNYKNTHFAPGSMILFTLISS